MGEDRRWRVQGTLAGPGDLERGRQPTAEDRAPKLRLGGDVEAGPDGAAIRSGNGLEQIAKVAFTSPDRVRDVINNFNDDAFDSLYPRYARGRPPTFTLPQRQQIKKMALSRPVDHGLPFST